MTTFGIIGVKVWIYKGEVLKGEAGARQRQIAEKTRGNKRRDDRNAGFKGERRDRQGGRDGSGGDFRRGDRPGGGFGGRGRDGGRGDAPQGPRPQGYFRNTPAPKKPVEAPPAEVEATVVDTPEVVETVETASEE
jgi:hypothetical protein